MCSGGLLNEISSVTVAGSALQELLPPLSEQEAVTESARYFDHALVPPCTHACPTHIDIPKFIKKISTGNLLGSARTILESNLLGATFALYGVLPEFKNCAKAYCVLGAGAQTHRHRAAAAPRNGLCLWAED